MKFHITIDDVVHLVEVELTEQGVTAGVDGIPRELDAIQVPGGVNLRIDGRVYDVMVAELPRNEASLSVRTVRTTATIASAEPTKNGQLLRRRGKSTPPPSREVRAPMPGRIVKLCVQNGDEVIRDQPLVVIEAMKMENELRATGAGLIDHIEVAEGDSVERDALLLRFR